MKAFFLSRLFREKVLLTGLIFFAAIMWLSSVGRRGSAFARTFSRTSSVLKDQNHWLDQKDVILARSRLAVESFDPSRTYDGLRLQGEMDQIARDLGISNTSSDEIRKEPAGEFTMNSLVFTIRNTDYASLVRFYKELSKRSPYIGLEQFRIAANRSNGAQVSATFRVSAVSEIAR